MKASDMAASQRLAETDIQCGEPEQTGAQHQKKDIEHD